MQVKAFDEVICCVCKNIDSIKMFTKDFPEHGYYGFMLTAMFLYSF